MRKLGVLVLAALLMLASGCAIGRSSSVVGLEGTWKEAGASSEPGADSQPVYMYVGPLTNGEYDATWVNSNNSTAQYSIKSKRQDFFADVNSPSSTYTLIGDRLLVAKYPYTDGTTGTILFERL